MDARAALLRAIIEEPDDDAHRLVFADWLEDDGKREWAALIRAQCALHSLLRDEDDPSVDARLLPLGGLSLALRRQVLEPLAGLYDEGWLTATEPRQPLFRWKVRRGFPEYLEVWSQAGVLAFLAEARGVFEQTPLRDLLVRSYQSYQGDLDWGSFASIEQGRIVPLLGVPAMARLRNLDLRGVCPLFTGARSITAHLTAAATKLPRTRIWVVDQGARRENVELREAYGARLIEAPAHADNPGRDTIPF
jgi:uncharacterized protein (TIGR02996 family)